MTLPSIVDEKTWLAARLELLAQEKELTRARDRLNEQRRRLPMVKINKQYVFESAAGRASLLDLFEGRRQLIVQHFMFDPLWEEGCPTCSCDADSLGDLSHLHARDTSFAAVSRAPAASVEAFKTRMGWTFPWYSSYGSDFNFDFRVTIDKNRGQLEYNYRVLPETDLDDASMEMPGVSVFSATGKTCSTRIPPTVGVPTCTTPHTSTST